jgi:hypothetical protein
MTQIPLAIDIPAWFHDHRFEGRAVLPAVEAMQALAASTRSQLPEAPCTRIIDAAFHKFLFLPPPDEGTCLAAFNDLTIDDDGRITSRLITRRRAGKSAITRVKEHVSLTFQGAPLAATVAPPLDAAALSMDHAFSVSAERVYAELVPFGPAYRNIQGSLCVTPEKAVAMVYGGPSTHSPEQCPLGAPFPLDAAFHAACVWGQRYYRVVAFPVGLGERILFTPTLPDQMYTALVTPVGSIRDELLFDIRLYDGTGALREAALQVRMRDVSAGRMRPPPWVLAANWH